MSKKLFALAGCTALAGTVFAAAASGCSSTTTTDNGSTDSGASSGVVDSGKKPVDSGTTSSSGGDSGASTCPDTTAIPNATIDAQWKWKAPNGFQKVCNTQDIAAVNAAFNNNANMTYDDVVKQISQAGNLPSGATCLACITSKEGDANYGYLVQLTDNTQNPPQFYIDNSGGCFALLTSAACGQAITYLNYCAGLACGGCTDNTSFSNCLGAKGVATACKEEITNFQSACNAYLTDLQNQNSALNAACGDAVDGISAMCNDGIYDGGKADGAP